MMQPPVTRAVKSATILVYLPFVAQQCESGLNFDIAQAVPTAAVGVIRRGICDIQLNLQNNFGGDIPGPVKSTITVKVVASGLGNQEPGGHGACCTALDENGARPFFDVLHPVWLDQAVSPGPWTGEVNLAKIAAHEYGHGWQATLGCLTIHDQPLGNWMNEGIAEYVAYDTYIRNGAMTTAAVRTFQLDSAIATGEVGVPLQSLEDPSSSPWPGHIGYLAIEKLVLDSSNMAIRTVCEQVEGGLSVDDAFQAAFGVSKAGFYAAFPEYIDGLRGSP
jgi:hypothetical protein